MTGFSHWLLDKYGLDTNDGNLDQDLFARQLTEWFTEVVPDEEVQTWLTDKLSADALALFEFGSFTVLPSQTDEDAAPVILFDNGETLALTGLNDGSGTSFSGVQSISQGLTDRLGSLTGVGGTKGFLGTSGLLSQGGFGVDAEGGGNLSGFSYGALGFPDPGTGGPEPIEEDGAESLVPSGTPTELLVQFAPGANPANMAAAASAIGGQVVETIHTPAMAAAGEGALVRVKIGAGLELEQAIEAMSQRPGVVFAEPNWGISVEATSDDPAYVDGTLWGMHGDGTSPANEYGSQAGEAWAMNHLGSYGTVAGVVDTGIDYTHPDLYLNVWLNQNEIPTDLKGQLTDVDSDGLITFWDLNEQVNRATEWVTDHNKNGYIDAGDLLADSGWADGFDTSANGYIDDLIGWDFVNDDNDPYDDHGHGTHVSGTIGGIGQNATGVAGVAWNVQLMALKFLSASGSGSTADAVKALDYYTTAGTITLTQDFVATNNSWGGGGYSQALLDSIVRGANEDVLFVAAAGNGGMNGRGDDNDKTAHYPSNYDTTAGAGYDAVIAVASIDGDTPCHRRPRALWSRDDGPPARLRSKLLSSTRPPGRRRWTARR